MKKASILFLVVLLLGVTTGMFFSKWKKGKKFPKQLNHHHHHHYVHHIHHVDHEDGEDKPKFVGDAQETHHTDSNDEDTEQIKKTPQYVVNKDLHQEVHYGFSNVKKNTNNSPKSEDHTNKPITNDIFPTTSKPKVDASISSKSEEESAKKGLYTDITSLYKLDEEKQPKNTYYNYFYLEPREKLSSNSVHQNDEVKINDYDYSLSGDKQTKIFGDEQNEFKYYTKKELDEEESKAILKANSSNKPLYYKNGDEEYKIVKILEVDLKNGKLEKVEPKVLYSIDHDGQDSDKIDDSLHANKKEEKTKEDSYSKSFTEIWK